MTTLVVVHPAHHHVQVTTHVKHGEETKTEVLKLEPGAPECHIHIYSGSKVTIEEVES